MKLLKRSNSRLVNPFTFAVPALAGLLALSPAGLLAKGVPDDSVTLRVTPERELLYRHGPREVVVEVELKAQPRADAHRTPMNVSVVLDRSGSMAGAKIEKARQAACVALDRLDADDMFSLVI